MAAISFHDDTEFVYAEAAKALDQQMGWIDALDGKAGVLLATNGVLIGLVVSATDALADAGTVVAVALMALVLGSLVAAGVSFATRNYVVAPSLDDLVVLMDSDPSVNLRAVALPSILNALEVNEPKVNQKATWLSAAGALLLVAAILFVGQFVYSVVR